MQKNRGRKGFTLPEVLVTLAIVATLAAVLLPALNSQLSKGDAGRGASDLVSLQTAIGAFASDVRRYPGAMVHLTTRPLSTDTDINGSAYGAGPVAKWKGPYLSKSLLGTGAVTDSLPTAFSATIRGPFRKAALGATDYVAITFKTITLSDFNKVDEIIDESASSSTGQLRHATPGDSATYYAVPLS
jgi:prepilin-type N-terminal cleavage/methylation domain-containing protein